MTQQQLYLWQHLLSAWTEQPYTNLPFILLWTVYCILPWRWTRPLSPTDVYKLFCYADDCVTTVDKRWWCHLNWQTKHSLNCNVMSPDVVCGWFWPEPASRLLTLAAAIVTNIILALVYSVLGGCITWSSPISSRVLTIDLLTISTIGRYKTPSLHTTIEWEPG